MSRNPKPLWPLASGSTLKIIEVYERNGMKVQKMLTEEIIGYSVTGGGRSASTVRPLYRTEIWMSPSSAKQKGALMSFSGCQHGDILNARGFNEDPMGVTLASIASQSIGALEYRGYLKARQPPPRRKGKKR